MDTDYHHIYKNSSENLLTPYSWETVLWSACYVCRVMLESLHALSCVLCLLESEEVGTIVPVVK